MASDKTTNIKEYELWRNRLLTAVEEAKDDGDIIVGEWTLKNIVSHLTGWAKYQVGLIEYLVDSREPQRWGNIDEFNMKNVKKEASKSFEKVVEDYKKTSESLIKAYSKLPENLWDIKVWLDMKATPKKLLNIEIRHIAKTHLPQITKSK